jgi:hypothetical protein
VQRTGMAAGRGRGLLYDFDHRAQRVEGSARAYRVLHLDAGQLGHTFHFVWTELGLAPFITTATDATQIERAPGFVGISDIRSVTRAACRA